MAEEDYSMKMTQWRALNQTDVNAMLDKLEITDPVLLRSCVRTGMSLEGLKGWFNRNYGNHEVRKADYDRMKAHRQSGH